jgi:hypothetical protein
LNEYYSATSITTTWSGKPLCGNVETLFFWLIQFCNRIQIYAWSKHISILPRIKKYFLAYRKRIKNWLFFNVFINLRKWRNNTLTFSGLQIRVKKRMLSLK